MTKIVITGIGVISPIGTGVENFWNALMAGKSGAARVTQVDVSSYACQIAAEVKDFKPEDYIDRKKMRRMDRFTQFAVAATKLAMDDAALDASKENLARVGVIVGSGIGGLRTMEDEFETLLTKGPKRVSPFLIPKLIVNMAAGEIAIQHGFLGPNYSVTSACATANNAIGEALRHLRYGDADVIIAGGTEAAITRLGLTGFSQAGALAENYNDNPEKASRPFDKNRSGFLMGEGAGIFVLETEEHAKKRGARIRAELAGYGTTDDAFHITSPNPEGKSQAEAVRMALADAKLSINDVDYINAHGTSTAINDKAETQVIKNVFGERAGKIPISSTKSMTGHLLGAAGGIELAATLLTMERGKIHPTINYETPDPECDLDYVPNKPRDAKVRSAISNSFGFGGHNAVIAVKEYPNGN